ncbi:MAG TPA: SRPBCC domain-containing protein [Burkholderiaceae bacterium]|nr:SRPBCC domain-containing protein [Burkholderiaceae bacterium]
MTVFSSSRRFTASPAELLDAFAQPDRLARWWGPAGFSNTFSRFDFRDGGLWDFTMHGPDGATYPNQCRFSAIDPARGLVIDHLNAPAFRLSITWQREGDATWLHWQQVMATVELAQALAPVCLPANEQNLDRLTAELGRI